MLADGGANLVWNVRLELGHQLHPDPLRTTEFAPALPPGSSQAVTRPASPAASAFASGYAPPATATRLGKPAASLAQTFLSNPMGRCGVQQGTCWSPMSDEERVDGSLRVVYAASIRDCRPCPLREQCQWNGSETRKPRQVSVLLHPLVVGDAPLLWRDWSRRAHRRACMQLVAHQRVEVPLEPPGTPPLASSPPILSRSKRAQYRLDWHERFARNGRASDAPQVTIKLFGVPHAFALWLGLTGE